MLAPVSANAGKHSSSLEVHKGIRNLRRSPIGLIKISTSVLVEIALTGFGLKFSPIEIVALLVESSERVENLGGLYEREETFEVGNGAYLIELGDGRRSSSSFLSKSNARTRSLSSEHRKQLEWKSCLNPLATTALSSWCLTNTLDLLSMRFFKHCRGFCQKVFHAAEGLVLSTLGGCLSIEHSSSVCHWLYCEDLPEYGIFYTKRFDEQLSMVLLVEEVAANED
ncbi:hypothetical protein Tco_0304376 [Tanacetum coccineum]